MPHIIFEYTQTLETSVDVPNLLTQLHSTLAHQGVPVERIKTRGIPLTHNVVGDAGRKGKLAHITLRLLEGRDVPTKQQYGEALYNVMKDALLSTGCSLTLEVRDMAKDTYIL